MKRIAFLVVAFCFVLASVLYTIFLAEELELEEQKKVEIWAEATRQFILAEPGADIEFISTIIEGNTTIPVFMTDENGQYMLSRNAHLPKRLQRTGLSDEEQALQDQKIAAFFQARVDELKEGENKPIEVRLPDDVVQYIYYDQSNTLRQLQYLPYLQFLLIVMFIVVAAISLKASHKAEENRVWVGLSKETAHQLGTPISSLAAWNELLRTQYPDNTAFCEIDRDIQRLTTITDRFSKIGSMPKLEAMELRPVVEEAMRYMQTRTSGRITYELQALWNPVVELNVPLFGWVIENLIRNAVDAMGGEGRITITLQEEKSYAVLDVTDTGKGIERRRWHQVFNPGHTTKQRGWGLGLSLAKRIVKDYHHGDIYVMTSEMGQGTTFRIRLKKSQK